MKWSVLVVILFLLSLQGFSQQTPEKKSQALHYFEEGEQALNEQKYKMALAHFNECLRMDPYYLDAYYSRAIAKEHLNDTKGALTDYNIFLNSKPENAEALFSRAVIRFQQDQFDLARQDFLKLLKLPPGETNTVYFRQDRFGGGTDKIFTSQSGGKATLYNYIGLIDMKNKKYKDAIASLDSAIHLEAKEPNYFVNRGMAWAKLRDTTAAIADYQHALTIDPNHTLATHNLAIIKRARGEIQESEILLDEAISKNPALPYPYAERGYYRLMNNNLKGALEDYDMVLSIDKKDEESYLNRGLVKEKLKDLKGAFTDYTEAISLKPDYEKAWLNRANLLVKLNRTDEAIEDYTVAITWYPEYALAYYNRAIAYNKLKRNKEACADLTQAIKLGSKVESGMKAKFCQAK
jgi:tetratricopeptide (TPR) repeat protein